MWIGFDILCYIAFVVPKEKKNQFKCKIRTNVLGIRLIPVRDVLIILLSQFKLFNIWEEENEKKNKPDVETIDTHIWRTDQIKTLSGVICAIFNRFCTNTCVECRHNLVRFRLLSIVLHKTCELTALLSAHRLFRPIPVQCLERERKSVRCDDKHKNERKKAVFVVSFLLNFRVFRSPRARERERKRENWYS